MQSRDVEAGTTNGTVMKKRLERELSQISQ